LLGLGGIVGMGFGSYFSCKPYTDRRSKSHRSCSNTPVLSNLIALVTLKEKLNMALLLGTGATIAGIWIIL